MKKILIIIFLFALNTYAEQVANGNISKIEKGEEASYSGFLVDKSQMEHFRQINEEKKLLEQKTIKMEELGKINEETIKYYKDSFFEVKKDYEKQVTKTFWTNTLYFFGGVALTGFISYGTIRMIGK